MTGSAPLVALIAVIGFTTNGFGLLSVSGPTKGGLPYSQNTIVPYNKIPDYLSVDIGSNEVGYTPKAYIAAPNGSSNDPLLGRIAPIFASNLTTLLGHEYPGIGLSGLAGRPGHCLAFPKVRFPRPRAVGKP